VNANPNLRRLLGLTFWLLPSLLGAHELDVSVSQAAPAVIVRATYGGSEPVPFARVQVFAPSSEEFQNGRTDRRGYFSFVPEGAGKWRVAVDDEEGHRGEAALDVLEPFRSVVQAPVARASRLERAVLGLALIFGITGFFYGFKARRRS
jgi:hypothetical protein